VSDCDHEVGTDEHVQLAELHFLHIIEVPGRAQHREQCVAVPLQLGTLMRGDRVVNRQAVQLELARHRPELVDIGPVQPDPRHALPLAQQLVGLLQARRVGRPPTVNVDGVLDQRHGHPHHRHLAASDSCVRGQSCTVSTLTNDRHETAP
jgi:hypothetical protein